MIGWIITLMIVGVLLFVVEIVLLPGITIAAIGSFCSIMGAVVMAFTYESPMVGWIVLVIALITIIILVIVFLRAATTWKRISLATKVTENLEVHRAEIGEIGVAITRLAPMGKVVINGETIEAKTTGGYIDEGKEVEVIGKDNMNIIVKLK